MQSLTARLNPLQIGDPIMLQAHRQRATRDGLFDRVSVACELIAYCGSDQVRSVRIKPLLNQQINLPQVDDAKVDRHFLRVTATILEFNYRHPNLPKDPQSSTYHLYTIYKPSNRILSHAFGGACKFAID